MQKLSVKWKSQYDREKYAKIIDKITRRYHSIEIEEVEAFSPNLRNFFQRNQYLTDISLYGCNVKASELNFMMKCVGERIKRLHMTWIEINSDCNVEKIELPALEVIKFGMMNSGKYFDLIINMITEAKNVKLFEYAEEYIIFSSGSTDLAKRFWQTLGDMKHLTQLTLNYKFCEGIFNCDEFLNVKFQLENFKFVRVSHKSSVTEHNNLFQFLTMQGSSIKKLFLKNVKISSKLLQIILNMSNLNSLKLYSVSFLPETVADYNQIFRINSSIQEMTFQTRVSMNESDDKMIRDFIMKCPNIRKVQYLSRTMSFETLNNLAYRMKNLQEICLVIYVAFFPMTLPNIKYLTIYGVNDDDIIRMILLNRHIKKLNLASRLQDDEERHMLYISAIAEAGVEAEFSYSNTIE